MNRATIAHHESGHAVSAYLLGMRLEYVTITPDDRFAGHTIVAVDDVREFVYWMARSVMTWSGILAGQRRLGAFVDELGGDDLEQLEVYAGMASLGAGEPAPFTAWTRARAMAFVSAHWDSVSAVALALLERDTLSGAEVGYIVDEVEGETGPTGPVRSDRPLVAVAAARLAPGSVLPPVAPADSGQGLGVGTQPPAATFDESAGV